MNKMIKIAAIGVLFSSSFSFASSPKSNTDFLKQLLFAEGSSQTAIAQTGGHLGDTHAVTEDCSVLVSKDADSVSITIVSASGQSLTFTSSLSHSNDMDVDTDENGAGMAQTFISPSVKSGAERQSLSILTNERPGEPGFNNIATIRINTKPATSWSKEHGKAVPSFEKSQWSELICSFSNE